MKNTLVVLFLMMTCTFSVWSQKHEKLNIRVPDWNKLSAGHTQSGEKLPILEGCTNALSYLEIHVTSL